MFDLNDIRYFLAVAQRGNLSAAARQLGVTQPTVGRRIRALEDALSARLFDRTNVGFALTGAGNDILKAAEGIEENAWIITNKVMGEEKRLSGKVRLATSEGLASAWLMHNLGAFRELHPTIELEILAGTALDDLLRREADVALRIGTTGSDELVGQCLGKVTFGLYASKQYLEQYGKPRKLSELTAHKILGSVGELENLAQSRQLRDLTLDTAVTLSSNNVATQMQAAIAGLGVAPLPAYVVAESCDLERVLENDFDVKLDLWLLTHRDLKFTARIRAVRDFLKNQLQHGAILR